MIVRVIDAERGTPVDGARISLRIASEPIGEGAWTYHEGMSVGRTGSDGRLAVEGLHPRRYLLDAEASGYLRHISGMRMLAPAMLGQKDITWHALTMGHWDPAWEEAIGDLPEVRALLPVVPSAGAAEVDVCLRRARLIEGIVRDTNGTPIPEAKVSMVSQRITQRIRGTWHSFGVDPNEPVFTNSEGRFAITVHPGGVVQIRVDAPDHVYEQRELNLDQNPPGRLEFVLGPCVSLRGRVLGPSGAPESEAVVAAIVPQEGGKVFHTKTDELGRFRLDDVDPKHLIVVAWAFFRGATWLQVAPSSSPLELMLQAPRTLRGRVVDPDGRPMNVMVSQKLILRMEEQFLTFGWMQTMMGGGFVQSGPPGLLSAGVPIQEPSALTDAQGWFSLETLLPDRGRVHLHVFKSEPSNFHKTMDCTISVSGDAEIVFRPEGHGLLHEELMARSVSTKEEYANRAGVRAATRDFAGAVADLTEALERWPDDPDLLESRGLYLRSLDRNAEAIADYTKLLNQRPQASIYYYRGLAHHAEQNHEAAVADLSEAIRLEPGDSGHWGFRASLRLRLNDGAGALADGEEAVRLAPEDPNSYLSRGAARKHLGNLTGARADFTKALELRSDYTYAFQVRAEVRRAQGDLEGALQDLQSALKSFDGPFDEWREHLKKEIRDLREQLGR